MKGRPLLELGTAYNSLRDSGFDFSTAIGEPLDNSIQAGSKNIKIFVLKQKAGKREKVNKVLIIDDGKGMTQETLSGCLQLGFSSRYNDRSGIGRFGVGATLAAISQCKRIEVYSRDNKNGPYFSTSIDLDDIAQGVQDSVPPAKQRELDKYLLDYVDSDTATIIVWDKCDRISEDPNGEILSAKPLIDDLEHWLSRAYRKFISQGVNIFIDGEKIKLHDPLFLDVARTKYKKDAPSEVVLDEEILWKVPGSKTKVSKIQIKMTLLDKSLRPYRGSGNSESSKARRIHENEGVSILRNEREVAFGNFWPMTPARDPRDRWWGCEISFSPELDECWQIKNVKRGARPIDSLREELNRILYKKIITLRNHVSEYWKTIKEKEKEELGVHGDAENIVKEIEKRSKPKVETSEEREKESLEKRKGILSDPNLEEKEKQDLGSKIDDGPKKLPITVRSKAMAGAEFMETDYIGKGQIIVTFNKSHPFFSKIYEKLEEMETSQDLKVAESAMEIRRSIDLLLMAFGRAESMLDLDNNLIQESLDELKSYWGVHLRKYLKALVGN